MRAKRLPVLLAVIVALGWAPSASAGAPRATPLEKVSSVVQPGIVYLETHWRGRVYDPVYGWIGGIDKVFKSTASCSGFFVNPDGHLVSAGHCVERQLGRKDILRAAAEWSYEHEAWKAGVSRQDVLDIALEFWKVRSAEDRARHQADRRVSAAYGVDIGGLPTGKALPARVLAVRGFDEGDVALLKIEAENAPVLELRGDAGVDIGTEVVTVGYPGSVDLVTDQTFDPSFKEGSISSEKTRDGGLVRAFEVSAAVAGGMSGGPTVDLSGRVIGVNSFRPVGESQPFNFVTPSAEVEALLSDEGVENRLGKSNATYRQALAAYYAGDRETALAKFDEVIGLVRSHQLAQEFRTKALRLPKPPPPASASPLPSIAGGSALALALVAARAADAAAPSASPWRDARRGVAADRRASHAAAAWPARARRRRPTATGEWPRWSPWTDDWRACGSRLPVSSSWAAGSSTSASTTLTCPRVTPRCARWTAVSWSPTSSHPAARA